MYAQTIQCVCVHVRKVVDAAPLVATGSDVQATKLWDIAMQIDKFTLAGPRQSCESDVDGERFTYGYTSTSGATLNITWMTIGSGGVARKVGDGPLQCLYTPTQCAIVGFDASTPPIDAAYELVANSFKFSIDYRPPASGYATASAMLLIDAFVAIAHPDQWTLPTITNTTFAGTRVFKSRGITQQTTDGRFTLVVDFPSLRSTVVGPSTCCKARKLHPVCMTSSATSTCSALARDICCSFLSTTSCTTIRRCSCCMRTLTTPPMAACHQVPSLRSSSSYCCSLLRLSAL